MSEPYLAEIKIFAGSFAPKGWALCNGQIMNITQNVALYSLLGTTYGGDGRTTFGLPNLQGQAPVQQGQGAGLSTYYLGQAGGTPTVTLLQSQMPTHQHDLVASTVNGTQTGSSGQMLSAARTGGRPPNQTRLYSTGAPTQAMVLNELSVAGSDQPHNNMMPYLALTYIICLQGIFPPRP